MTPTETNQAGVASGQRVSIEYPEYEDDPIWQSALRDADITLPEGMTVAPEAGLGLHRCSAEQFGVDSATGRQLNDDPHMCPDASQIGSLEVTTPVLDFPLGGKAFLGPASGPGRPTPASPWRLFLLVEGAGQRIKLTGEMTISEQGQVRLALADMPQLPFTRLDLVTLGGEDAILENPPICGPHQGTATLTGWSGTQKASIPSVTPTGCTLSGVQQDGVAAHEEVGHQEQAEGGPLTPLGGPRALASSASVEAHAEGDRIVVSGDDGINEITVSLAGGIFTISDSAGVTAGPGCAQAGADVTCPAAGITSTVINGLGGGDTLIGSSIADRIDGGPGPDDIDGREGDDIINSGRGGIDLDLCLDTPPFRCSDSIFGGLGFDLITYADRTGPIKTDLRPGRGFARDDDDTFDGINATEAIVGGRASDELIGGASGDHLNGGPGNAPDTICGGLGNDTVDYTDKSGPVTVTIDGTLPTDPDIVTTDPIRSTGARQDCRPTIKSTGIGNGQPDPNDPRRDCTANDGVAGENDCVGEDVENIVGSPFDDTLVGNDPDALYGLGPRVEPAGANHLMGGAGNDLLDGGLGPDIFEGGSGADTVTYEGRTEAVRASIDGAGRDGNGQDFNARSQRGDEIGLDIERLVGENGHDLLRGDANANVLRGGPGNDFANGGEGDDGLFGDSGHDRLEGGAGDDLVSGGEGDDSLEGWKGNDQIQGDAGSDTADYRGAKVGVTVDLSRGGAQFTGGAGSGARWRRSRISWVVPGTIGSPEVRGRTSSHAAREPTR